MVRGLRLGVLALRLGVLVAAASAVAWVLVAIRGAELLRIAGWLSVAWAVSVVGIAVLVGGRRWLFVRGVGILGAVWSASLRGRGGSLASRA